MSAASSVKTVVVAVGLGVACGSGTVPKDPVAASPASNALVVSTPSPENPCMSSVGQIIVDTWNFSDPSTTEARFRELAAKASDDGCPEDSLEFETQVARAMGLQKRMDEADAILDNVEQALAGAPPAVSVRYQLERGRILNSSGDSERARPLFEAAFSEAQAAKLSYLAVDAAHMVAITYGKDPDLAIEWNERALGIVESSEDELTGRWKASLYNNLGWVYHDRKDFERALELFEKALEDRRARGEQQPIRIARWAVARALRSLGRLDEALKVQTELHAEYQQLGVTSGFVLEELAECHLALGAAERARPFFKQAHDELSKNAWLVNSEPDRIERLGRLGR